MSVGFLSYVTCCAPVAKAPKAVLAALADFANEDGVAWPVVETIALHSGWSERAVQDALRLLERDHHIEAVPGYVYQRRKANAKAMPYRLLVTLCRWNGEPPMDSVWAKHCRHQSQKGRRSRTPSGAAPQTAGAQVPHPSTESEGVQIPPARGADPANRGAGPAPELPRELPADDGSPSQVTVTSARDGAPLRGLGPDDVWCASCDQHHPRSQHLAPRPAPSDWRSRTVSDDDGPDGIEVDDELPYQYQDVPFPDLDETQETYG